MLCINTCIIKFSFNIYIGRSKNTLSILDHKMIKILFTLLIGLYFLSILSCSQHEKKESSIEVSDIYDYKLPSVPPNQNVSSINENNTINDEIKDESPFSVPPKKTSKKRKQNDYSYNQNANSTPQRVRQPIQQTQSSSNGSNSHSINNTRTNILNVVKQAARRYGVKSSLICAIINQESGWKSKVISHAGAVGLMQIMPATGRSACNLSRKELFNPSKNINCGVYYFSQQFKRFNSKKLALCAYNAGPHRIVQYGKCPPFKETQHYHKVVLAAYKRGNSCKKAPSRIIAGLPDSISVSDDMDFSAKGKADVEFIKNKGKYSAKQWWGLVCKNIDKVYYEKIGSTEPARTQKQIKLWSKIFNVTVKDIYQDELRLKGKNAMPKNRISDNIKQNCPKTTKPQPYQEPSLNPRSAKDMADKIFTKNGYTNPRYWWRIVCEAVDQKYYTNTGNFIANTDYEKEIWKNILRATVDDIHRDELKNKGYEAAMNKYDIKKNIISSCPSKI
jgi:hypothetical protein